FVLVGEVQVDRRGRDADRVGDGANRDRTLVAGLEQQALGGVDDLLAEAFALAPRRTAAPGGPGRLLRLGDGLAHEANPPTGRGRVPRPTGPGAAGPAGADGASLMPIRSCRRRIHRGAHQFQSPARRMNAGTSVPRIRVASRITASASPTPSSLMNVISE